MITFFMVLSLFASFILGYFACLILTAAKVSDLEAEVWKLEKNNVITSRAWELLGKELSERKEKEN